GYTAWPYKMIGPWESSFTMVKEPANWDKIVEFEKAARMNYDDIIAARDKCGQDVARKAMTDFIENCKHGNCVRLQHYINSMNFND
ncbi:MAG: glycoside hydrolase family 5 protein, partial [Muribaculaceae bacterium]|nr:glycoside hydrolase family 5 protein [Muribaculaceae bacterium]